MDANVSGSDGFFGGRPVEQIEPEEVLLATRQILSKYLEVDLEEIHPDARLYELPDVDSMKLMVAGLRFEQEFGVIFEMDPMIATRTVAELAGLAVSALRGSS
jgi:acyl carrier protein